MSIRCRFRSLKSSGSEPRQLNTGWTYSGDESPHQARHVAGARPISLWPWVDQSGETEIVGPPGPFSQPFVQGLDHDRRGTHRL